MFKHLKLTILIVTVSLGSEIIWQLYQFNKKRRQIPVESTKIVDKVTVIEMEPELDPYIIAQNKRKPPELWNTVLFFPDPNFLEPGSTTMQLYSFLENAKVSIQMCIYLSAETVFRQIIRKKKDQGLIVQVITDYDTMQNHNVNCRVFRHRGQIPVRSRSTGFFMHNKFILIDEEAVITGSLNITKIGLCNNSENVIVTTDTRIVQEYRKEYSRLWVESEEMERGKF